MTLESCTDSPRAASQAVCKGCSKTCRQSSPCSGSRRISGFGRGLLGASGSSNLGAGASATLQPWRLSLAAVLVVASEMLPNLGPFLPLYAPAVSRKLSTPALPGPSCSQQWCFRCLLCRSSQLGLFDPIWLGTFCQWLFIETRLILPGKGSFLDKFPQLGTKFRSCQKVPFLHLLKGKNSVFSGLKPVLVLKFKLVNLKKNCFN